MGGIAHVAEQPVQPGEIALPMAVDLLTEKLVE